MPFSTDVNLPKSHKARFPNKCVVCGRPSPESTVRLITGSIGPWTWLLWHFGTPFTVKAPACTVCGWRLQVLRLTSLLVTIGACVVAIVVVWPMVSDRVPRAARKWIVMGIALISLSPYFLYHTFFPPPFDITAYGDSVDYEFRNADLACEFAELNQDAEWVKIG
jgi:hypothetical protein